MTITNLLLIVGLVLTIPILVLTGILSIVKIIETKKEDEMNSELKKEDLLKLLKESTENFNKWVTSMTSIIESIEYLDSSKKTMEDLDLTLANLKKEEREDN